MAYTHGDVELCPVLGERVRLLVHLGEHQGVTEGVTARDDGDGSVQKRGEDQSR